MAVKAELYWISTVPALLAVLAGCGSGPIPAPTTEPPQLVLPTQITPLIDLFTPTPTLAPTDTPTLTPTLEPIPTPTPDKENPKVSQRIEAQFGMERKDHIFLSSGLEIFLYSEPETTITLDPDALEIAIAGRLKYLNAVVDGRYRNIFEIANNRSRHTRCKGIACIWS